MNPARKYWVGGAAIVVSFFIFVIPFIYTFLMAIKDARESSKRDFSWPTNGIHLWENLVDVIKTRDYMLVTAMVNSTFLTVVGVTLLVLFGAMVGFVLQRRKTIWTPLVNFGVLAGLVIPPAIVPTIWIMQGLTVFGTMHGIILVQVAYGLPFTVLLFQAFFATVPRELDEAAIIDGAGPLRIFFTIMLPLMRPVVVTVIVVNSVGIFNDFVNPLYYLPGTNNATVQLTLYNFQNQFRTQYNLLFMNILLITIPPLIVFLAFNKQIVSGLTAGAVKG